MNKIYININDDFSYSNSFLDKFDLWENSEINIDFVSDFRSAKILRSFISDLSDKLKIENKWKARLILIADELNNNAIEYWSKPWENNSFKTIINFDSNDTLISFEVNDSWNGKKAKKAKDMIMLRNKKKLNWFHKNNWIRGRGLFMIIEKLVDKLYFKDWENGWLIVGIEVALEIKK